jgi:hypothetical protein
VVEGEGGHSQRARSRGAGIILVMGGREGLRRQGLRRRVRVKVKIDALPAVIALFRQQNKFAEGPSRLDCIYDSPKGTSRPFQFKLRQLWGPKDCCEILH